MIATPLQPATDELTTHRITGDAPVSNPAVASIVRSSPEDGGPSDTETPLPGRSALGDNATLAAILALEETLRRPPYYATSRGLPPQRPTLALREYLSYPPLLNGSAGLPPLSALAYPELGHSSLLPPQIGLGLPVLATPFPAAGILDTKRLDQSHRVVVDSPPPDPNSIESIPDPRLFREYIEIPREHDVLCGRGGKSNHHPGNKYFRQVVSDTKARYRKIGSKIAKTNVSRKIVQKLYKKGGRFLKMDPQKKQYYVLSPCEARKKTSQALRETRVMKWTS